MSSDPKDEARRAQRHELRTPLNQILGYSELLHEDASARGEESMARDLEKIQAAARRMLELVEALLPGSPDDAPAPGRPRPRRGPGLRTGAPQATGGDEAVGQVLVVDDNEMNRDMLSRRLSSRGYTVTIAGEGEAALRLLAAERFDAVLLDVMMPGHHRHRGAAPHSQLGFRVRPARDHGHGPRRRRGRGRGAAPGRQRLRDEAPRLPGGPGPPAHPARLEAAEGRDPASRGRTRDQEPVHPADLRPLPERRDRERPPRVAPGAGARRRAAAGHHPHGRPARLHLDRGEAQPRPRGPAAQLVPRGHGRGHPRAPGDDRRVHRRRHPGRLRRARAPRRRRAPGGGLCGRHAGGASSP